MQVSLSKTRFREYNFLFRKFNFVIKNDKIAVSVPLHPVPFLAGGQLWVQYFEKGEIKKKCLRWGGGGACQKRLCKMKYGVEGWISHVGLDLPQQFIN